MANTIELHLLENRRVKVTKNGLTLAEDNSYRIIAGEEEATIFHIVSKPLDYELADYTVEMVNSKGYGIMETAIVGDEFTLPISMATAGYGKIGIRAYQGDEVVTFEPIMVKVWNFIPNWKEQADIGAKVKKLIVEDLEADSLLVDGKEVQEKITEDNKLSSDLIDGLDDAIEDINDALDKKADIVSLEDGSLGVKRAEISLVAENLTPLSPESGTAQDIPFISQGTGCGNGTAQVDTGSYGIIKNKRGFGLNVNQLIESIVLASGTYNGCPITNNGDGTITLNGTASAPIYTKIANFDTCEANHYYLILGGRAGCYFGFYGNGGTNFFTNDSGFAIAKYNSTQTVNFQFATPAGTYNNVRVKPQLVDLTLMYGNNAWIPSDLLSHPENFFRYYQGSLAYDTGSWAYANGRYVVTTGRNIWNERWEVGSIRSTNGTDTTDANAIRSVGYIEIIPNSSYYFRSPTVLYLRYYDQNKNYIGNDSGNNTTKTIPANVKFIRFVKDGNTYGNDVTVSLYYTGESGYNEYYPYEELDIIDTGTEELLQAGEVSDIKVDDGTITHNLVEINLAEKTWTLVEETGYWYFVGSSPSNIRSVGSANLPNARSDKYMTVEMNNAGFANNTFAIDNQFILVRTSSTSVTPTGTIIAELDEPTTEQGTPYQSTLNINDFGTMYWLTSDNATPSVPQGIEIFYPVDYKAYVDTLYNHTDGDATNLVTQSDLVEIESVDTQLKNALGGTLRQCLCVKESLDLYNTDFTDLGSLTWSKNANNLGFYSSDLQQSVKLNTRKILCTEYEAEQTATTWVANKIGINNTGVIWVGELAISTADDFKSAMKGILLAYEKA